MPSQPSGTSVPDTTQIPQEESPFDPNGDHATLPERDPEGTYAELSAPFDVTFTDVRGGVELTYISGEQVASRLNQVLMPQHWSFFIEREGYEEAIDWLWCLGKLEATIDGTRCVREQFGGAQLKRGKPLCAFVDESGEVCNDKQWDHNKRHSHDFIPQSRGVPLNLGYDKKAAATDAFKKCAQGIGVGLYLSARRQTQDGKGVSAAVNRPKQPPRQQPPQNGSRSASSSNGTAGSAPARAVAAAPKCQSPSCGAVLQPVDEDGVKWTVEDLVRYGKAITRELGHEKIVCFKHYLAARDHRNKKQQPEQSAG